MFYTRRYKAKGTKRQMGGTRAGTRVDRSRGRHGKWKGLREEPNKNYRNPKNHKSASTEQECENSILNLECCYEINTFFAFKSHAFCCNVILAQLSAMLGIKKKSLKYPEKKGRKEKSTEGKANLAGKTVRQVGIYIRVVVPV